METRVSIEKAALSLGELLEQVNLSREPIVIERNGRALGRLSPIVGESTAKPRATARDLVDALRSSLHVDDGWAEGVEEAMRFGNQPTSGESPWDR